MFTSVGTLSSRSGGGELVCTLECWLDTLDDRTRLAITGLVNGAVGGVHGGETSNRDQKPPIGEPTATPKISNFFCGGLMDMNAYVALLRRPPHPLSVCLCSYFIRLHKEQVLLN